MAWSSQALAWDGPADGLTPRAALSPGIRSWQAPRDAAPRPRCIPRPLSVCAMIRGYSGLGAVLDQAEEVPAPTTAASPAPEPPQQAAPAAAPPPADEPRLNRTGRTMTIVVPVKDGPRMLGDVDAQITPDDALLLSVEGLATLLSRQLSTDKLAELRSTPAQDGFAPLAAFERLGLPLQFDKRSLELTLTIATQDRALRSIGIAARDRDTIGEFAAPEDFSAYVNIRGSLDYIHKGSNTGFDDPFFLFDGAARLGGVVLESEGQWDGRDKRFRRTGSRLVYDDAKRLIRWTAGDVSSQNRGFQGSMDLAGLGLTRSYALLDPQRSVTPRGGRTFSLDRDATVEAIVNGRMVRTMRLQPGTYNVSDFPFAQGGNDVELVITDDTGRRDVISFTMFIERSQLAAGLSEYSLNVGVLETRSRGIDYSNDIALSGFYRRGLSDRLTLGGNFQYANKAYLVGSEIVLGTDWGTIGGDVAFSHLPAGGNGWAANFSLERVTQGTANGSSLIATVEARSRRFGAVGQLAPDNPYQYNAMISYNKSIDEGSFVGVQARYAHARRGFANERSVRLSYGRRLDRATNLVFDAEWSRGIRGDDKSFRISLVRRFGIRSSARAEYDSSNDRVRLGYQSSGGYGVGAWSGSANVDIGPDTRSLNANGSYVANRADLSLAHTTAYSTQTDSISDQRTSLRVASSLAFAGGSFAVGRPISDGFAIIRPYKSGQGLKVEVEQSQGSYQARSGTFGPALYPQIGSYSPRTLVYDVPNASAGLDIGTGSLRVLPPYRAGYVVSVGSDYNVMAIGQLTAPNGEPLELRVGYATEIGGDRRVELFTNRQGKFAISGVKAGRWRIEMSGTPPIVYELDIAETDSGIARVGTITPTDER
ncbi:fimbrial biogenesis outer membrane usher protein [Sphingopyxis panaciterrulae]|uniref:Outer membrane usher protein n=1 Tax=Sphingopyxis panaciterrulae TaxID=462372 RepID=A0A7W9B4G5_9SPHN|nr:fimbrial biogenesis outer membrane usher protein [Sphingopyxis panaciterrulae]MBB5706119.1 outer membrane usher protein [Sphingopyxis panaciterrulae]